MKKEDAILLESLIDKYAPSGVLAELANICHEKAQHIRENWQDKALAKEWDKNGSKIAGIILL